MDSSQISDNTYGSVIGTKQYWDTFYETELQNYNNFTDSGHIWFGLSNTQKIIKWIDDNVHKTQSVVDIGCGNGYLLIELAKLGYNRLCGIDYSSNAIDLCVSIAKKQSIQQNSIDFAVHNIMEDSSKWYIDDTKYDCIVDKGTFDAICLKPDIDISDVRHKYRNAILNIMSPNSVFIVMSCNNTKQELCEHLMVDTIFSLIHEFESPKFSFGGCVGQQVTGIVLKLLDTQSI